MKEQILQKERNMKDHPYYFCHFLNMAHHNVFLILQEIYNSVYEKYMEDKDENIKAICESLINKSKKNPDEKGKIMNICIRHFPFLEYYKEMDDNCDVLSILLDPFLVHLNDLRNQFSHYKHPQQNYEISDFHLLFEHARTDAQMRMKYSDEDISKVKAKVVNNHSRLTERGILFFICLFLDKKNAYQFLSKISGFRYRRHDELYKLATLEVFSQYYCHVPYKKLDSSDVALDMLNELNRCPKALYHVLSDEDKAKFIVDDMEDENHQDEIPDEDGEDNQETPRSIMRRSEDRFPYFALRYFEKQNNLDKVSFHLYLGRKEAKQDHKKLINGEMRTHKLLKDIHVFGNLENYRRKDISDAIKNRHDIEFYAPSYRIVENRIGLLLRKQKDFTLDDATKDDIFNNNICPDVILSTHELGALFFYNYLYKKGLIDSAPHLYIQNFIEDFKRFIEDIKSGQLTPVEPEDDFYLMKKKRRDEAKDKDKKSVAVLERRRDKLREKLKKYHLEPDWIPDACREYLLSYKADQKDYYIKQRFVGMRSETDSRIKQIEAIRKREDNSIIRQVRVGEIAQELARDIVFFIPPYKNEQGADTKINNMEFDVLQKMLAYFPLNKKDIYPFLKNIRNWDKHPFLKYSLRKERESLLDFYQEYLNCKKIWISKNIRYDKQKGNYLVDVNKTGQECEYFLKTRSIKAAKEKEYFVEPEKPLYLPTNFFVAPIVEAMRKNGYELKDNSNVAGCLKAYFTDKVQPMYGLPRYYMYYDGEKEKSIQRDELKQLIKEKFEKKGTDSDTIRFLKKAAKRIRENESEILAQQMNDRVLFLMVNDLLEGGKFRREDLQNIGYNKHQNLLDQEYDMCETICGRKVTARLPIKRYGEFRRFMKDRRLDNLVRFYPGGYENPILSGIPESSKVMEKNKKYSYSNLYDELEIYDKDRDDVLILIYEVDKILIDHFPDKIEKSKDGYYDHYHCLDFAKKEFGLETDVDLLSQENFKDLRNALYHNQIPYNDWLADNINKDTEEPMYVRRIFSFIGNVYSRLLDQIKIKIEEDGYKCK